MVCLRKWWEEAGCTVQGIASPDLDSFQVDWWNGVDASTVQSDMGEHFRLASENHINYPARCLGIIIRSSSNHASIYMHALN